MLMAAWLGRAKRDELHPLITSTAVVKKCPNLSAEKPPSTTPGPSHAPHMHSSPSPQNPPQPPPGAHVPGAYLTSAAASTPRGAPTA